MRRQGRFPLSFRYNLLVRFKNGENGKSSRCNPVLGFSWHPASGLAEKTKRKRRRTTTTKGHLFYLSMTSLHLKRTHISFTLPKSLTVLGCGEMGRHSSFSGTALLGPITETGIQKKARFQCNVIFIKST